MREDGRGTAGYLKRLKIRRGSMTLLLLLAALTMYLVAKKIIGTSANLFTILAVVSLLPVAKGLVVLLMTFPYHSVKREWVEKMREALPEGSSVLAELLLSTPERLYYAPLCVLIGRKLLLLCEQGAKHIPDLQHYLREEFKIRKLSAQIKVFTSEGELLREAKAPSTGTMTQEEVQEISSYLLSLVYR